MVRRRFALLPLSSWPCPRSVPYKNLYKLMRPKLPVIMHNLLQTFCLSDSEVAMFKEDPQEFVRRDLGRQSRGQPGPLTGAECRRDGAVPRPARLGRRVAHRAREGNRLEAGSKRFGPC